jgi:P-aminobenzoate N-oxygenase AurF
MNKAVDMEPVQRWYANATVRNSPRILVPDSATDEYIFPRARQPISEHPKVVALGHPAVNYVLAQSTYKYMYEIGLLETKYVIDCGLKIVNDQIMPGAATEMDKLDALTIVIDEGYHAHVALDFIIQMKEKIGISPLKVPQTNGNLDAVGRAFASLPESAHRDFELISVCLAEHTLTKDLLSIGREQEASRTFTQVMTDHVSDEGRHANYFARLVKRNWTSMSEENRMIIGQMLPSYLDDYLAGDEDREFDRMVLAACGLNPEDMEEVLRDTSASYYEAMHGYIIKTKANLISLLGRMGVLDHAPTRAAFDAHLGQASAA